MCRRGWTFLIARIGIELGAIGSIGHDLAVGTTETGTRPVPFAAPDDDVPQNVLLLHGRHELVEDGGAEPQGQEPESDNPPLRVAYLPHLLDQRQVDEGAVYRGC